MSNHMHLLVRSSTGSLSDTIRDFKRHTSKQIVRAIEETEESRCEWLMMIFKYAARKHKRNNTYQVWTHENHAIEVFTNDFIDQKIDYIHNNPVVAGIVGKPEDYLYSSARNYSDKEAVLEVIQVCRRWKTY